VRTVVTDVVDVISGQHQQSGYYICMVVIFSNLLTSVWHQMYSIAAVSLSCHICWI